ncbi:MAG: hypothetical protein D6791_15285 [Chloroflexi bacterium]|nr:MAG: hypothetical protein D6791_15285 [Chloroflexota bacterium]
MTSTLREQTLPDDRSRQRRQALVVLILGLALAAVAVILALQSKSAVSPPTDLVMGQDTFPVASLAGIDNANALPEPGHPAPNFAFRLPDGSSVTLADYRGQPVLINFWASWCGPCRLEMPELVKAYETHKDDGLVVLEVNVAESNETVAAFVAEFNMTMPVIIDARQEVMALYKTQSLPSSFFVDRDGIVQRRWIGFLDSQILEENLATILG